MKKLNLERIKWRNISIGWKYSSAFIVTLLLFALSVIIVAIQLNTVSKNIDQVHRRGDRSIELKEMASIFREKDIRIADYIYSNDRQFITQFKQRVDQIATHEKALEPKMDTPEQKQLFNTVKRNSDQIDYLFLNGIVSSVGRKDDQGIAKLRKETQTLREQTTVSLDQLGQIVDNERTTAINNAKSSLNQAVILLITCVIISMLLGGLAIYFITRIIRRRLESVVVLTSQVSQGHLNIEKLNDKSNDEIGQLSGAVNKMKDSLHAMVVEMVQVSDRVSSQSEELSQSSREVKEGSEQVAATMEELASGAENQASSVTTVFEVVSGQNETIYKARTNGEYIEQTSLEVLDMTEEGNRMMQTSVDKMQAIHEIVKTSVEKVSGLAKHSQAITKLVDVIHSIANQTNLLALNAAIEAARAGEHGKGFAVVADEVRQLSEQVSASIDEITTIVNNIQVESSNVTTTLEQGYDQVKEGTDQVNLSGEKFNAINEAVKGMNKQVSEISLVLQQIADNSHTISQSVENVSSISEQAAAGIEETSASVQQTSAAMEEISANSEDLAKQAETLNELVRRFKL
ncbi:methyl-accepting chemotaxis protein [Pullulanibacillus pueri]|uniref:Putative sensory transducer protein YvaQ n=1 Tax=Pullulanibacillus pueri TaxID=1437324 RepID=A0A8J2ZWJ1_9BACL|nr:HAMP domain-containing methyl-accepting chemotaxis protein [Pullulanibacillus pueri]MBM7680886.1 methyl-accepting chemotaxis protein [Pullulanibacillus pueri]GGH81210.1 putative sensory transducer protein YvaQ [Pullulanibacillus pueri]